MINPKNLSSISDTCLYRLCRKFGYMTLEARRKFIGLLPEVYRRGLYKKKGYRSIHHFAGKLAGLSNEQVDRVLSIEKSYEDKPILHSALVRGEISVNKLSRIRSIATTENEGELFEKTKYLSSRAVEVFVKDVKNQGRLTKVGTVAGDVHVHGSDGGNEGGLRIGHMPGSDEAKSDGLNTGHVFLDSDVKKELANMQEKGIDINEFLREALRRRKEEIEKKKKEIGERERARYTANQPANRTATRPANQSANNAKPASQPATRPANKSANIATRPATRPAKSRYINAKIREVLREEYGTKCSVPHCKKPAEAVHHTLRFAMSPLHDPRFLAPLCKEHHEIAHKIDARTLEFSGKFP